MEAIQSLLATNERVPAPASVAGWFAPENGAALANAASDPLGFWSACAERLVWETAPQATLEGTLGNARWYAGGRLNATVSCLDRHAASRPQALAYRYLREDGFEQTLTYAELLAATNRLANASRADGVAPGDRVCIYMPLSLEGIVAMLACARIGAVHSVVYAGLGATALRDRIEDAGATVMICADVTFRRGSLVDLRSIVDDAVVRAPSVRRVIVWRRSAVPAALRPHERDYDAYVLGQSQACEAHVVEANDPLFILYTSGTTGKPKGVVMSHGGYLAGTAGMFAATTGIGPGDAYWCTSDIGWIVGHSLIVYGALANGYASIIREGAPDYPLPTSVYAIIERYRVTKLYTAPTLARMLMRLGEEAARAHDLSSLEAVYCAGEPLNPEAWHFLFDHVGRGRAAVCNHWWQTETGAMMLGNLPPADVRPDRSGLSFGPLEFEVVAADGSAIPRGAGGLLVIRSAWPMMFSAVWNDPERYASYFETIANAYAAGDVATIDAEGYMTVLGRADDVLNVAGHRIATADVESALVSHPACGEAAAVGLPDPIKGEVIKAFVVLRDGFAADDALRAGLIAHVRYHLGPIGTPAQLEFTAKLPKTRSGKIMRRLLRAREAGLDLGDTTTLDE